MLLRGGYGSCVVSIQGETAMKLAKSILYAALLMLGASASLASTLYDVDEDRDGRADRQLMLEQSDALA
jgi:hypothetical protein